MKQPGLFLKMGGALLAALLMCGGLSAQTGYDCLPMIVDPDCEREVPLLAAQDMEVGVVVVQSNELEVCVTYILSEEALADGWLLYEAHLAVALELGDIPQTAGNKFGTNPIPGLFPDQETLMEGVPCLTFCIPLADLEAEPGDMLYIAAHAVVGYWEDDMLMTETAWGEGNRFNERGNWGMYFMYTLCEPDEPTVTTSYIGYEDRDAGFDFDYNDFGMDFGAIETYSGDVLTQINMTFVARVNRAGDVHDIHIKRLLEGNYTYTIIRPDHTAEGTEALPVTDQAGSGPLDVILFDTVNWPNSALQEMGQTVIVIVDLLTDLNTVDDIAAAPRFDIDADFSLYDPYMYNRTQGNTVNIAHWVPAHAPLAMFGDPAAYGYEVPSILVVPVADWAHPAETEPIVTPYPDFDDYYFTASPPLYEDWWVAP